MKMMPYKWLHQPSGGIFERLFEGELYNHPQSYIIVYHKWAVQTCINHQNMGGVPLLY
jgi:hypothetical protein